MAAMTHPTTWTVGDGAAWNGRRPSVSSRSASSIMSWSSSSVIRSPSSFATRSRFLSHRPSGPGWLRHRLHSIVPPPSSSEIIFFIWCLNRSIGELAELQSFTMEGLLIYASSHWNQIDLISSALLTVTTCLRLTGHGDSIWHGPLDSRGPWLDHNANDPNAPWGDHLPANLTALMVILIYYRILQYLRCNESVGVLTIVLNQMVRER